MKKLIKSKTSSSALRHHQTLVVQEEMPRLFIYCISDVKGPKRIFPDLSFSSPDGEKVEVRKSQLDAFLKVSIGIITFAFAEF